MTEAELRVLIEGAIGGVVLSLLAFLLSRFVSEVAGRTVLATVLFAAAGAYFGLAFEEGRYEIWVLVELLQTIAFGALGLYGWRGNAKWLALGYALHPFWDFGMHYVGPGRTFAPWELAILCISFDWVVAAYILIYYRGASRLMPSLRR
jgi:hypothetical protein